LAGQQVHSRNHHKMLRREIEKVEALCKVLDEKEPLFPEFGAEEG
jgi:hypothetical protein